MWFSRTTSNEPPESSPGKTCLKLGFFLFVLLEAEYLIILMLTYQFNRLVYFWSFHQYLTYMALTMLLWAVGLAGNLLFARLKYGINQFAQPQTVHKGEWLLIALILVTSTSLLRLAQEGQFHLVVIYRQLVARFSAKGMMALLARCGYLMGQAGLLTFIIDYGQRAGEAFFKFRKVPWGGIALMLTWGVVRALADGSPMPLLLSMFYGVIYMLCGKELRRAIPVIALAYLL